MKLSEVRAWLAAHGAPGTCGYGRSAVAARIRQAPTTPGGRHGWFVAAVVRVVELAEDGCCSAADFQALTAKLDEIKPEGGTDPVSVLAWAIANADGSTGCQEHNPEARVDVHELTGTGCAPVLVPVKPQQIEEVHRTFRRWLGDAYDLQALDVVLAAVAVEQLDGDPVWLLLISGSGNTKTETVSSLAAVPGVVITSTIKSEGALLSGTRAREKAKDATGGGCSGRRRSPSGGRRPSRRAARSP